MSKTLPSPRQLQFQDWEFGLFLHLGMYTFDRTEGFSWKNPSSFSPNELDCDQWIAAAKDAGMRYAVLTVKHHEGFCLWPTGFGEYSVKQSSWRDHKGDVVKEYTDACHRHGIKVGLYYSPYDAAMPLYEKDPKAYDDYFIGHMRELLTNYGAVDILWFDGCHSEGHTYDWKRITGEIRSLQPEVLLFSMGDPDFRWVGNEYGIAHSPNWNIVDSLSFSILQELDEETIGQQKRWLPAECDCRMRLHSWGWRPDDEHTVKSVEELMGLYYYSVGRGCNLLINIGPDPRGLLPEADRKRLSEFGSEIRKRFGKPVAGIGDTRREGNTWFFEPSDRVLLDHAVLQEDIQFGESVRRFAVRLFTGDSSKPITVYEGRSIGHKAICRFPAVSAASMMVEVEEAEGEVRMRNMDFHCAGVPQSVHT